ncbi:hypothetical protein FQN51_000844 [Onygenales sp. PD_10]|nr:hypothetical protein FQN51_000844 [Onygenales sp. PD_10]
MAAAAAGTMRTVSPMAAATSQRLAAELTDAITRTSKPAAKAEESHAATIIVVTQTARSAALVALSATAPTPARKLQANVVRAVAAIADQQSATTQIPPFVAQTAMMRGLATRARNAAINPRAATTLRRRNAVILVLAAMTRPVAGRMKGAVQMDSAQPARLLQV